MMPDRRLRRRDFLKVSGASAATLGASGAVRLEQPVGIKTGRAGGAAAITAAAAAKSPEIALDSQYPKLAMITPYSPQKLAFATAAGYEGVVIPLDDFFDPDRLTDSQIDQIMATSRETGARIISIECMWGLNHIHPNPAEREKVHARFIRCLEFAHRLGSKFCGTFSGGMPGEPVDRQVKEFAAVVNEKYMPVCERLGIGMGWENYPTKENFATVPAIWERIFELVPNRHLGLEFDTSHFIRQYIDSVRTAWHFRDSILAGLAKYSVISWTGLRHVGIRGTGW